MILRRALLIGLLAVFSAGAGLIVRDLREARADRARSEQASQELISGVGSAPSPTPAPKWS